MAGWICEPDYQLSYGWMCDVPWVVANDRDRHTSMIPVNTPVGVAKWVTPLVRVRAKDALREVFYGDGQDGNLIGLAKMYGTTDCAKAQCAANVIDARGKGDDLRSAWLISWGPRTIYMATPNGGPIDFWSDCALCLADWRYVFRICNIDADMPEADLKPFLAQATDFAPMCASDEQRRPMLYIGEQTPWLKGLLSYELIPMRRVPELDCREERVQ